MRLVHLLLRSLLHRGLVHIRLAHRRLVHLGLVHRLLPRRALVRTVRLLRCVCLVEVVVATLRLLSGEVVLGLARA